MHSAEKACDTTLDAIKNMICVVVKALGKYYYTVFNVPYVSHK